MSLPWPGKPPPLPREEVLSAAPALPRPPLPPMLPARPLWCRYHPEQRAQGAVNRGWGPDGWVFLCEACVGALKARRLVVVAPSGAYGGSYPGVDRPDGEVPPGEDLFE